MSFRFNVDLSFDFPCPPPRNGQRQTQTASSPAEQNGSEPIKPGFPGWIQTARQHPHYCLRLLYFIACIIGLITNSIVLSRVWSANLNYVHQAATTLLIVGFIWQFLNLYALRLFHGRRIPNWLIAVVETLGFGGSLALVTLGNIAVKDAENYNYSGLDMVDVTFMAYDSSVWIVLCLVHAILAIKSYAQGVRNVRSKRAKCLDCEHAQGTENGNTHEEGDGALLGEAAGEAEPSQEATSAPYRDEPEAGETV